MDQGRPKLLPAWKDIDQSSRRLQKPDMISSLQKLAIVGLVLAALVAGMTPALEAEAEAESPAHEVISTFYERIWRLLRHYRLAVYSWIVATVCAVHFGFRHRSVKPTFLLDFACFKPADYLKSNYEVSQFVTRTYAEQFSIPSLEFQRRIFLRSGLGQETYVPPVLGNPAKPKSADALAEAEYVLFGSVRELFTKTHIQPKDISVLVTNCSLHCPTPSYASMIINHFKLREDCKSFHLAGMGCSASLVACKLASDLMRNRPNQYALVVSTENITRNWYVGNEKPMLVANCLFRLGCAAILLTNNPSEKSKSKYELLHLIRTHKAADSKAFGCAQQREDGNGILGVALNQNLMGVAADALRTNLRTLGPLILPFSEQLRFVFSILCKEILNMKVKQYQPDFKLAVQHFCIHAGGRAVIDEVQRNLYLDEYLLEPSRSTLHRFGNTSASSLWYVLAYMEAKERIKLNDKIWMLGLGSGFKCNSAVWRAMADVRASTGNPWADCVSRYPASMKVAIAT